MFVHVGMNGLVCGHVYLIADDKTLPGYFPAVFLWRNAEGQHRFGHLGPRKVFELSAGEVAERVFVLSDQEWEALKNELQFLFCELETTSFCRFPTITFTSQGQICQSVRISESVQGFAELEMIQWGLKHLPLGKSVRTRESARRQLRTAGRIRNLFGSQIRSLK